MISEMSDAATPSQPGSPDGPDDPPAGNHPGSPHPWAEPDRPRGLDAYFAPGGEDEAPPERADDERRLTRLLILMVLLLVGIPTLLTLVAFVARLATPQGGG